MCLTPPPCSQSASVLSTSGLSVFTPYAKLDDAALNRLPKECISRKGLVLEPQTAQGAAEGASHPTGGRVDERLSRERTTCPGLVSLRLREAHSLSQAQVFCVLSKGSSMMRNSPSNSRLSNHSPLGAIQCNSEEMRFLWQLLGRVSHPSSPRRTQGASHRRRRQELSTRSHRGGEESLQTEQLRGCAGVLPDPDIDPCLSMPGALTDLPHRGPQPLLIETEACGLEMLHRVSKVILLNYSGRHFQLEEI